MKQCDGKVYEICGIFSHFSDNCPRLLTHGTIICKDNNDVFMRSLALAHRPVGLLVFLHSMMSFVNISQQSCDGVPHSSENKHRCIFEFILSYSLKSHPTPPSPTTAPSLLLPPIPSPPPLYSPFLFLLSWVLPTFAHTLQCSANTKTKREFKIDHFCITEKQYSLVSLDIGKI